MIEVNFNTTNPEFNGAYLAICDDNITTAKLFDGCMEMYSWIQDQLENKGVERVAVTVLDQSGEVSKKLIADVKYYFIDEDCYEGGKYEPAIGDNIREQCRYVDRFSWV